MAKGISKVQTFSCTRCSNKYSRESQAKECFDKGLPERLKPGTTYVRGTKYFSVKFLTGKPRPLTHERDYIVDVFPAATSDGYELGHEFIQATASFDGKTLHSIKSCHPKGALIDFGYGSANRLTDSELQELMGREDFKRFHEAASFGKRTRGTQTAP